ncbi:DUF1822 family protein [Iningainema tapete]|uniref:DUF1822 family protein n=1 Tax=Iningainema tapete BLCC-T55 TaxID=2748662 RepID=A0A8J7BZC1_9CYAN|nr:DUF1822 family protein [Iningainema tapete]MBD2777272.1 DUF1822 family protein [Iningainema tapete BLCC-T55]
MTNTQSEYITVLLSEDAHRWAKEFATQQATIEKSKRVYLNTLAVYAVHSYLKWLMIETDITQGDSWQPGLRVLFDVADLVVPGVGKLECRPVLPGEDGFSFSWHVTDRIGYVAVQFQQQLDSVQLLGFVSAIATDELPKKIHLAQLQPLDTLLYLIETNSVISPEPSLVNLRLWLEGIFNQDWQPAALVLNSNFKSFRDSTKITNSLRRAKNINLAEQLLILVVQPTPITEKIDICLQLYPGNNGIYLPENLQITVFDQSETACMEARTNRDSNRIEFKFSCQLGEKFSVKIMWENFSVTEQFIV